MDTIAYHAQRAARYDEESHFDKGNRQQHYQVLVDLLKYIGKTQLHFCDLGCGTGYFASAFFEVAPGSTGVAIDISQPMLDLARQRLEEHDGKMEFLCRGFQDFDWTAAKGRFDVVFSSMAIHHLDDVEKRELFHQICNALSPAGWFVLYDIVRCARPAETELLEYLACTDIQRRLLSHLEADFVPEELRIEQIIANDRRIRSSEGDQESTLEMHMDALKQAGFDSVIQVIQDARIAGLVSRKFPRAPFGAEE